MSPAWKTADMLYALAATLPDHADLLRHAAGQLIRRDALAAKVKRVLAVIDEFEGARHNIGN